MAEKTKKRSIGSERKREQEAREEITSILSLILRVFIYLCSLHTAVTHQFYLPRFTFGDYISLSIRVACTRTLARERTRVCVRARVCLRSIFKRHQCSLNFYLYAIKNMRDIIFRTALKSECSALFFRRWPCKIHSLI